MLYIVINNLFRSGKMKSLERKNEDLRDEIAIRDETIEQLQSNIKQIGLSAMDFAELIKGRGLNFTGRLFSSEHNRWFATEIPLYRFCEITIGGLS